MRRRPGTGDSFAKKRKITGALEVKGAGPTLPDDEAVLGTVGEALGIQNSHAHGCTTFSGVKVYGQQV